MIVIISAIIIFILLCFAAFLAFVAPVNQQTNTTSINRNIDSVMLTLAQHSKNVPAVIDAVREEE